MNQAFREAANQIRQKPVKLTHNQEVARLYRKSLKTLCSWVIDRDCFLERATELRGRFDAERGCSNARGVRLLREAKAELFEFTHPDPYCVPYMPGGSLFMRNPPPPLEICFPDGDYPADAPKHTMNPDMTICRPETGKSAVGGVLVDFGKKNME
mmetsp:Transcript_5357/g.8932  ORF Transcript_5357/g.8932 Transcript_5357/m.8932 type:complete len:155 (-) Transcript_5357:246-710(-)|eukprot:CAMPEP_0196143728 /NCGR_PEP_ID=MMETSP0910-20130528/13683_1 /TAXON_ID=49265 /ORGANISM="Thalassiosira rotula, Strain GSO102" /LENGTH=154 /DNA_ID=CAMNT_0041405215 /DNA_START=167 /DNA_END=631 /DNA_ORIENTATION=-